MSKFCFKDAWKIFAGSCRVLGGLYCQVCSSSFERRKVNFRPGTAVCSALPDMRVQMDRACLQ